MYSLIITVKSISEVVALRSQPEFVNYPSQRRKENDYSLPSMIRPPPLQVNNSIIGGDI